MTTAEHREDDGPALAQQQPTAAVENGNSNYLDAVVAADREIEALLEQAGLEGALIDPSSLEALQQMMLVKHHHHHHPTSKMPPVLPTKSIGNAATATASATTAGAASLAPLVSQVVQESGILQRDVSDLTSSLQTQTQPTATTMTRNSPASGFAGKTSGLDDVSEVDSDATTAGLSARSTTAAAVMTTEEKILQHLERQHELLTDLRRRMDELTYSVHAMHTNSMNYYPPRGPAVLPYGGPAGMNRQLKQPPPQQQQQQNQQRQPLTPMEAYHDFKQRQLQQPANFAQQHPRTAQPPPFPGQQRQAPGVGAAAAAAAAPPLRQPNLPVMNGLTFLCQKIMDMPQQIRDSRMARIVSLFLQLRRRRVPDIDFGLLVKVLVMIAILTARMSSGTSARRPPRDNDGDDDYMYETWIWISKFYVLATVVVVGFLFQTGYASFLYQFFVKENYPARIWNGEDIDPEQPAAAPAAAPPNNAAGAAAAARDRQGNAPANPVNNNAAAAAGAAQPPQERAAVPWWNLRETFWGGRIARPDPMQPAAAANVVVTLVHDLFLLFASFFLSIFPMWRPEAAPQPQREEPAAEPQQIPEVQPPDDPVEEEDDEEEEEEEEEE